MKTIETTGTISSEHLLTVLVPEDIPPGLRKVVVILEEAAQDQRPHPPFDFPVDHYGSWPANLSLRREDLYGTNGR